MSRLRLPSVTLCAAASVNVAATVRALTISLDRLHVAECLLFTDASPVLLDPRIRLVKTARLQSSADYSRFMLNRLGNYIETDHCLVVQWDGFVLDPSRWQPEFLEVDYVGARWPQFPDGQDVGNGGFSLRSRRLLEACASPAFRRSHPEDLAICRENRRLLERNGIRFASPALADAFATERSGDLRQSFGFHGVFNMVPVLGAARFREVLRLLDERTTVENDRWVLARQLLREGKDGLLALPALLHPSRFSNGAQAASRPASAR